MTYDVFTLGETMVRFTPKGHARLEESTELDLRIGGSESNVAVALSRLGLRVAWASRLPDNALGELTLRRLRSFGVDVSAVRRVEGGRMGLYFIEPGAAPRSSRVLYDRAHSAASEMGPGDFDWALLGHCRHVHLTGITPALSATAAETTAAAIREAKERKKTVSFDVNYRARLWSPKAAQAALLPLIRDVDLLIAPLADAVTVFGIEGSPEDTAAELGTLAPAAQVAVTLGAEGALLWDRREFHRAASFPVQLVDRVGAGDAFDAGLLWGYLQGDAPKGLLYGMAMAAIKHTIPGDEWVSSLAEVEALLENGHRDIQR